jgi:AcrR family transcriptional regulator
VARPRGSAANPEATTRERILDVALDLFVRKGYAETSLREIAAELGFSKAALYYHFESKQDILLALHRRVHDLTDEALPLLEAEREAEDDSAWLRVVDGLISVALRNRRLIELHLRNQEVILEMHRDATVLGKHGPNRNEVEDYVMGMVRDPSTPVDRRVRRIASLGIVAGALLGGGALADVSDADLEAAVRTIVHEVLGGSGTER